MPIFRGFIELMKSYLSANKQAANVIHITAHDEQAILGALDELPDPLKSKILTEGVQAAFQRIFGMRTVWNAEQTKVDHEGALPVGFR